MSENSGKNTSCIMSLFTKDMKKMRFKSLPFTALNSLTLPNFLSVALANSVTLLALL